MTDWRPGVVAALSGDPAAMTSVADAAPTTPNPPTTDTTDATRATPVDQATTADLPTGPDDLLALMAQAGWSAAALRHHALTTWQAGQAWPDRLDPATSRLLGPARWSALVRALADRLELGGVATAPSRRRRLTPDERRLLAEVPPHHGPVG